ncbi:MAG: GNAT family N-acetyltransferase [Clostridiales bacterium]|nr:GNAT family N-acetyltransferase [Clostridiales bacterium]
MTLKRLRAEKMESIIAFNKLCFPTDYWKEEDWMDLLNDERAVYYALLDDEQIVGDAFIYNWKGENDYVKIMNVAVHPDYRKQGLAQKLLTHVSNEMKKIEMKKLCGETRVSNKNMQKAFESCGYRLDRIEEGYFTNPDESAFKYVLQL